MPLSWRSSATGATGTSQPGFFRLNRPARLSVRLAAILWLLSAFISNLAQAIDSLDLTLGQIGGEEWKAEGVELNLAFGTGEAARYSLSAKSVQHPSLPFVLESPLIECHKGILTSGRVGCQQGMLHLKHPWLKKSAIPVSFDWLNEKRQLLLKSARVPMRFGDLHLELNHEGGQWRAKVSSRKLDTEKLLQIVKEFPAAEPFRNIGFRAMLNARLNLAGSNSELNRVVWDVGFREGGFEHPEGTYLAESLNGKWSGNARIKGKRWKGEQSVTLDSGALLTPYFYMEPEEVPAVLHLDFAYDDATGKVSASRLAFQDRGTLSFEAAGDYVVTDDPASGGIEKLDLTSHGINLPKLYSRYLQPVMAESPYESLELEGEFDLELSMSKDQLSRISARLKDVYIEQRSDEDAESLFALYKLAGNVNWQASEGSKASEISWEGGHLLEKISIGPSLLPLKLEGERIELSSAARIPLFDGALNAEEFHVVMAGADTKIGFQGYLTPISMEVFSQALGWPILSGQLSGMIPGVSYEQGTFSIDGMALFRVFDGDVVIKDLVLEDIFGVLPVLTADISLNNLDLESLTRTFSFGKITGKLDGRVDALRLEDWHPISFDARFSTPENDDSRHRINQKAVDNISNLGGAGVSGALSRSFLRFFEEFSYDRLGISCRLENGVCEMGGIEPTERGYYLVKGGGLPRIDIMGFNKRTDWDVLISKLKQISEGGAPVIE
ncbi:MAG: hypothetical protein ABW082_11985 [Sedimenticola sp.]